MLDPNWSPKSGTNESSWKDSNWGWPTTSLQWLWVGSLSTVLNLPLAGEESQPECLSFGRPWLCWTFVLVWCCSGLCGSFLFRCCSRRHPCCTSRSVDRSAQLPSLTSPLYRRYAKCYGSLHLVWHCESFNETHYLRTTELKYQLLSSVWSDPTF